MIGDYSHAALKKFGNNRVEPTQNPWVQHFPDGNSGSTATAYHYRASDVTGVPLAVPYPNSLGEIARDAGTQGTPIFGGVPVNGIKEIGPNITLSTDTVIGRPILQVLLGPVIEAAYVTHTDSVPLIGHYVDLGGTHGSVQKIASVAQFSQSTWPTIAAGALTDKFGQQKRRWLVIGKDTTKGTVKLLAC